MDIVDRKYLEYFYKVINGLTKKKILLVSINCCRGRLLTVIIFKNTAENQLADEKYEKRYNNNFTSLVNHGIVSRHFF